MEIFLDTPYFANQSRKLFIFLRSSIHSIEICSFMTGEINCSLDMPRESKRPSRLKHFVSMALIRLTVSFPSKYIRSSEWLFLLFRSSLATAPLECSVTHLPGRW